MVSPFNPHMAATSRCLAERVCALCWLSSRGEQCRGGQRSFHSRSCACIVIRFVADNSKSVIAAMMTHFLAAGSAVLIHQITEREDAVEDCDWYVHLVRLIPGSLCRCSKIPSTLCALPLSHDCRVCPLTLWRNFHSPRMHTGAPFESFKMIV